MLNARPHLCLMDAKTVAVPVEGDARRRRRRPGRAVPLCVGACAMCAPCAPLCPGSPGGLLSKGTRGEDGAGRLRPVGTGQRGAFRDSGGHTARKGQVRVSTGASALRAPWRRWASASARGGPQAVFPGGCAAVAPALAAAVSSQRQGAGGSRGPTLRVQGGPSPVQQQLARDLGLRRHFQICTVDCEST